MRNANRGPMVRLRDDSGVIAIVVALSVSTFLLGFAALAVDLGVAYTRKAQLQSIADRLAVATAEGLPATTGANTNGDPGALDTLATQWDRLCQTGAEGRQIFDSTVCPSASLGWATDGDPKNGEVEFVNDSDGGLNYSLPAAPSTPASATAVRVELPPSTVQFGFGAIFGASSTAVQKAASARIGTPLGMGLLPIPISATDVNNGQLCVVDPDVPKAVNYFPPPTPTSGAPVLRINPPGSVPFDPFADPNTKITVNLTLRVFDPAIQARNLKVFNSAEPAGVDPTGQTGPVTVGWNEKDYSFTVQVPLQDAGTNLHLWVTGQQRVPSFFGLRWRNFRTATDDLVFSGRPAPDVDPCSLPQAPTRGYAPIARTAGGPALDQLESNVRGGPQPELYTPSLLSSLLGPIADLCVAAAVKPASACLTDDATPGFSDSVRDGLLTSGDGRSGRLIGDCGNGTTSSNGYSGIDASKLVSSGSPLVDPAFGTGNALRTSIVTGGTPKAGWVTAKALSCPRMAVLPVLSNSSLLSPAGGRQISGFVYFWIDGITADRGMDWTGSDLHSLSGYVIKPGYLPPVVAGSGVVGPYLGDTMPKEATLICDLGDRQLGRCAG